MSKQLLFLLLLIIPVNLYSQSPSVLDENLSIRAVAEAPNLSARISFNPQDSTLYLLTQAGEIFSVGIESGDVTEVQSTSNHGLSDVQGLDISTDGKFYIVGNNKDEDELTNIATIKKGEINNGDWEWTTVATTEPWPISNTYFDHIMNAVIVSPDNKYLYINSGSRTDHGEEHLGEREVPLTAKILRIPADTVDLLLENDVEFLQEKGFLYADGTRNSFGMAFDGEGNLFATDNAGERDDPEELNWIREGHHYGFPWRMGGNDTPMQYEGYVPEDDVLLPTESGSYHYFYNDPEYPAPPDTINFTEPILNTGPDAVNYTDPETGEIFSASETDTAIASFTSHRSPLGLVFDRDSVLQDDYTGDAFALAFAGIDDDWYLLRFMDDPGEDLVHIELTKTDEDTYEMTSTIIANGFTSPVDSEIIGDKIYIVEHKGNGLNSWANTRIWEVDFSGNTTSNEQNSSEIAKRFQLNQNYPNPFNPTTQISYNLSAPGLVTLEVFDAIGRKVQTLVNQHQSAGSYTTTFDAANMPSGMYFYQLKLAGQQNSQQIKKMILLR